MDAASRMAADDMRGCYEILSKLATLENKLSHMPIALDHAMIVMASNFGVNAYYKAVTPKPTDSTHLISASAK